MDPSTALVVPTPSAPIPDIVDIGLHFPDFVTPSHWLLWVIERMCGTNPVEWVTEHFSGDWEKMSTASSALEHLATYHELYAAELDAIRAEFERGWDGNAQAAASSYFRSLAGDVEAQAGPLRDIAREVDNVAQPEDDEPYVDDESGGVCVMEFTDVMPPAMQATEVSAGFANEALMTMLAQSAWTDPGAEDAVASIAEAFETCAGEYTGVWGDNAVVVTTEALEMEVPGAAVSVCRYFEMTVDGESDAYGPMCIAASGDRMVGLLGILLDDTVGLAPEDYQGVMAVAAAKVFAG